MTRHPVSATSRAGVSSLSTECVFRLSLTFRNSSYRFRPYR
jgi:hypothetical protein